MSKLYRVCGLSFAAGVMLALAAVATLGLAQATAVLMPIALAVTIFGGALLAVHYANK